MAPTYDEKIKNMLSVFDLAIDTFKNDKTKWNRIKENAKQMRFTWDTSVDEYYKDLYLLS